MAKRTITWPPVVEGGRLSMTADPTGAADADARGAALRQVIRLRLGDGYSTNGFNAPDRLGIADPTFGAASVSGLATIRSEVVRHFRALERERRAKLVTVAVDPGQAGTVTVRIEYEDLETGGRDRMELARNV